MEKLLQMLNSLIECLEVSEPRVESREWYLTNNLRRFREVIENSPSQHEFENAEKVLSRFNVDSMDWDDPLFKQTTSITEQARRVNL